MKRTAFWEVLRMCVELVNQRAQYVVLKEASFQEMLLKGEKDDTNL